VLWQALKINALAAMLRNSAIFNCYINQQVTVAIRFEATEGALEIGNYPSFVNL
jgi:hypothetical protein